MEKDYKNNAGIVFADGKYEIHPGLDKTLTTAVVDDNKSKVA